MKFIFAGPCGVGKSTIASLIAAQFEIIKHLDLDTIRRQSYEKHKGQPSPCSLSSLDLKKCLEPILNLHSNGFILDIGGGTIFRPKANNKERLAQVGWIKETYGVSVVVLVADKQVLYQRFQASKVGRTTDEFEKVWEDWQTIEEPHWKRCEDCRIDTTSFVLPEKELQLPTGFLQLLEIVCK